MYTIWTKDLTKSERKRTNPHTLPKYTFWQTDWGPQNSGFRKHELFMLALWVGVLHWSSEMGSSNCFYQRKSKGSWRIFISDDTAEGWAGAAQAPSPLIFPLLSTEEPGLFCIMPFSATGSSMVDSGHGDQNFLKVGSSWRGPVFRSLRCTLEAMAGSQPLSSLVTLSNHKVISSVSPSTPTMMQDHGSKIQAFPNHRSRHPRLWAKTSVSSLKVGFSQVLVMVTVLVWIRMGPISSYLNVCSLVGGTIWEDLGGMAYWKRCVIGGRI